MSKKKGLKISFLYKSYERGKSIMREIGSEKQRALKEARKRKIMVIVIGIILVFSILGSYYGLSDEGNEEKITYKGIDFELQENGWYSSISGYEFSTFYNPLETENISIAIQNDINNYAGMPLYFSDDSLHEGIGEIEKNLYALVSRSQFACFTENCTQYAVKNCTDNLIIIQESKNNETFIKQEENCIFITAPNNEILRACDRFLFKIIGL